VRVKLALVAGMLLIAAAAGAALTRVPPTVSRRNAPPTHAYLVSTSDPTGACQTGEALPADTSAIRLGLTAILGPEVTVSVFSGSRLVAAGTQAPGWEGGSVTIPLKPLARAFAPVRVCLRMRQMNGTVSMLGWRTRHDVAAVAEGKPLPGRMHIEYLRPGRASWWSMARSAARRLGFGHALTGPWNALLAMVLAASLIVLSSWLIVRELR
jgi:hypothetical protein